MLFLSDDGEFHIVVHCQWLNSDNNIGIVLFKMIISSDSQDVLKFYIDIETILCRIADKSYLFLLFIPYHSSRHTPTH